MSETTLAAGVEGLACIDGLDHYAIPDIARMSPFLMSVVSDGDRWMFVSSTGALTAGRMNADRALFPYETDDRLHDSAGLVGPVTRIRSRSDEGTRLWRPFDRCSGPTPDRTVAKTVTGDSVVFGERQESLGLSFSYRWSSSARDGFVRHAVLRNHGHTSVAVDLIDGLVQILPADLGRNVYERMRNLSNAYRRSEVLAQDVRLAAFTLESHITDRPQASEVLRANVAWSTGLPNSTLTLDRSAIDTFEGSGHVAANHLVTGRPGAYLLSATLELPPGGETSWFIVADVFQSQSDVTALRHRLRTSPPPKPDLARVPIESASALHEIMAPADAQQATSDPVATAHHVANVTYNVMRGGVPLDGYRIDTFDFGRYVADHSARTFNRHSDALEALSGTIDHGELLDFVRGTSDPDLIRLGHGYLPFHFARRHGDPSRPWNAFSIRLEDDAGRPLVYYEGNWRDIFQNWEALCQSFPNLLPSVIATFVNASTADGHNPYRLTRDGIDWEVPEPDDPWSNIGYWGDHQVVYLERLLAAARRFLPGSVEAMLTEDWFTYADVPYRLAGYEQMVGDPKDTIVYDTDAADRTAARVASTGHDGRLLHDDSGSIRRVSLLEKLLVPALAKLSNFVPGGGIWMNTQRPEWNDANNAIVGPGLSMVTAFHLRRYLDTLRRFLTGAGSGGVECSVEVVDWMADVAGAIEEAGDAFDDPGRRRHMDRLGHAFERYRTRLYADGLSGRRQMSFDDARALCESAIGFLDVTLRAARTGSGTFHSYNLIRFDSHDGAAIEHLPEMLEGQVAAIASGLLSATETADVVDALFAGPLYRSDQNSFILYPAGQLSSFLDKNVIPPPLMSDNPLLRALAEADDHSIVTTDADGRYRFGPSISNTDALNAALDALAERDGWESLATERRSAVIDAYNAVFEHHRYTGRSSSMYAYEGIGSIYWHMVAKLMVAIQDATFEAREHGAPPTAVDRLVEAYDRVRSGLGYNKSAAAFGAVPTDPYSHTPAHAGAQQPGMTGLVKEELLTRPAELGVRVVDGCLGFDPLFLRTQELLSEPRAWNVTGPGGVEAAIQLATGSLGLTVCQVPVAVSTSDGPPEVVIHCGDGTRRVIAGTRLDRELSRAVFARSGTIAHIEATLSVNGGSSTAGSSE